MHSEDSGKLLLECRRELRMHMRKKRLRRGGSHKSIKSLHLPLRRRGGENFHRKQQRPSCSFGRKLQGQLLYLFLPPVERHIFFLWISAQKLTLFFLQRFGETFDAAKTRCFSGEGRTRRRRRRSLFSRFDRPSPAHSVRQLRRRRRRCRHRRRRRRRRR